MMDALARLGVKRTLLLAIGAAVVLAGAFTAWGINRVVLGALEESLLTRGLSDARVLASEVSAAVVGGSPAVVAARLDDRFDQGQDAYAVVVRADQTVVASQLARHHAPGVEEVVQAHARAGMAASFRADGLLRFTAPIVVTQARADGTHEDRLVGHVLLGVSSIKVNQRLREVRLLVLGLLGAGGLAMATLVYLFTVRLVLFPLDRMSEVARRMSDSDLTARAARGGEDEMGKLADSLNRIGENLAGTLSRVQTVTGGIAEVIERIGRTGAAVSAGAGTVSARAVETSSSMGEMISSLKGIADNVEVLAGSAEESSSSILEMAATNDEVAENIQALAASVQETTAAIEEMTYSIKEVAKNIEDLSTTTEQTSSSMNEMDVSISQVETNANETARLSEQAQRDAEMGAEALSRTLLGIDKIKESSKEAASVIEALGRKIAAIGNILNVIDDVAEQTNLLALNAAIIAAQSGEHGKGFAVVADEIKDLAERTGASTKEICRADPGGAGAVEERRSPPWTAASATSRRACGWARRPRPRSRRSRPRRTRPPRWCSAIARATVEQARGSKQVTDAIIRIAETVQQIATATAEQARGSEQIMKSAEKMKAITKHVERSSQEQARGSKQITRAIESISEMVHHLNRAQKDQTRGSEQVMGAVVQIKQVAEAQNLSAHDLQQAIADLAAQAEVLRGEVRRFRL